MLIHRLPFDEFATASPTSNPTCQTDSIARIDERIAVSALFCLDIVFCAGVSLALGFETVPRAIDPTAHLLSAWLLPNCLAWTLASVFLRPYSSLGSMKDMQPVLSGLRVCLLYGLILAAAGWLVGASDQATWQSFGLAVACMTGWIGVSRSIWAGILLMLLDRGYCLQRAMVIAGSPSAARVASAELELASHGRLRVAIMATHPGADPAGALSDIATALRACCIDRTFVTDCAVAGKHAGVLTAQLISLCTDITMISATGELQRVVAAPPQITTLKRASPPLTKAQATCKRILDLAVVSATIVVSMPVLLIISVLIALDSRGPILFKQDRRGTNGATFRVWKFRTMHHNPAGLALPLQTARDDMRITRIGRPLRKSSLDELPQLFNVLVGDMSIVGPRPHAVGMTVSGLPVDGMMEDYEARHCVRPGMTGWAQVNGCRGELANMRTLRRRLALDFHYIRHWSLGMDIRIIIRTVALVVRDRHAC